VYERLYDVGVKPRAWRWVAAYVLVVAAFLAAVARYYHPPYGFTAFIEFPAATHADELPRVREAPHYDAPSPGYDGQFYAQLAVEPLLRDAAIDRAMDETLYRVRRILFSWTAFALGLGRPGWVLQAYAAQNVLAWLLLAWLLTRWIPPVDARRFVLWTGCLWSHGLLMSVRYALVDGPSVLLLALAVVAAERRRPLWTSLVLGAAGLARETNLLGVSVLGRFLRRERRSWLLVGGCIVLALVPLALWLDYLRSIYRAGVLAAGGDHVTMPLAGIAGKLESTLAGLSGAESMTSWLTLAALAAVLVQAGCVVTALVRSPESNRPAWAWLAAPFVLLALAAHPVVWEGHPGAFTRVLLPLTVGATALLAQQERPSWWLVAGVSLSAIPGAVFFV
jgi:hypothetical protein